MKLRAAVLLACCCLSCGVAFAAAGPVPEPVRLPAAAHPDASQTLRFASAGSVRELSLADIEALGLHEVRTATFWPADDGVYQGVLLRDVLKAAGLGDALAVRVAALDGFSQLLPRADWMRWPVLLATRRDGKPMSVRNKGPFRIIYPRDMSPALDDPIYRLRWVWLIRSIEAVAE
ncbi:hypothetical protein dqs_1820 [Azoarcus olearius]|uniref:molybdopterin-dependent oxidoreductase n=1 Tax=Azoarcus sp. (strain BH72) TaxID=418699 RepID=UPI0008060C54|nr:molybdopterin-dependent oxidoreductase [Azoarcus olearius]ANQ84858.1 hypothetical protein dqs_1820 [Azoarcus olearius]